MPIELHFTKDTDQNFRETTESFVRSVQQQKSHFSFGRTLCVEHVNEDSFSFNETTRTYIFSPNPNAHFEKMAQQKLEDCVQIINISADCPYLYNTVFSQKLAKYLFKIGYLNDAQTKAYQMAFQESLSNAVEYGCLQMGGLKDKTVDNENWFEHYRETIEQRLKQEEFKNKKILIHIYLKSGKICTSIEDEGLGFNIKERDNSETIYGSHGMGRTLIEGLTDSHEYDLEGKRISFCYRAPFAHKNEDFVEDLHDPSLMRKNAHILIVDDQRSNREFANLYLKSAGYTNISEASDGAEAIEIAKNTIPDLILMDIIMDNVDGFTACRKIKQMEETRDIPILFLSGLDDSESKVKGYRIGAMDYINKPIDRNELIARTDTHIRSTQMLKALKEYSSRTQKDLNRASQIQGRLLPNKASLNLLRHKHDLNIDSIYEACEELAGDYWTILDIDEHNIGIIMADFTGHGVVAALHTIRLHTLIQEFTPLLNDPEQFIYNLNDRLYQQTDIETFLTFTYCVLNTKTGQMNYFAAGSPSIAIIPKGKDTPKMLDCSGLPLGLIPSKSMKLEERCAHIIEGDSLLFYSDALIETQHADGNMWQEDGLCQKLLDLKEKYTHIGLEDLAKSFKRSANKPLKDDLTLLMITRAAGQTEEDLMSELTNTIVSETE